MARLGKPHRVAIYPPTGRTREEGHDFVYLAAPVWESHVVTFLDRYTRR